MRRGGVAASAVAFALLACAEASTTPPPTREECTDDAQSLHYNGFLYRTLYNASKADTNLDGCQEHAYAQMPPGYYIAPDDADIVTNVIAAHRWGTYRLSTEKNCYCTAMCADIGITAGENRAGKEWGTDNAGRWNVTCVDTGDSYYRLLIRKPCGTCTEAAPFGPLGPVSAPGLDYQGLAAGMWPDDFCIHVDLTTPGADKGGVIAAVGGTGDCGHLYLRVWNGKLSMGIMCLAGSSAAFLVQTKEAVYTDGGRYKFSWCVSGTYNGLSRIFVDGNLVHYASNFPIGMVPKTGTVSLYSGSHQTHSEHPTEGTLHQFVLACEHGKYITTSPSVSPTAPITSPPTVAHPAGVTYNGAEVTPVHVDSANMTWLSSIGLRLYNIPPRVVGGNAHMYPLGESILVPENGGSTAEVQVRCEIDPCDIYVYEYHQPPLSSQTNGLLPATLVSEGWTPSSCAPTFKLDSEGSNHCKHPMVAFRKQITNHQSSTGWVDWDGNAAEVVDIDISTDAKYVVVFTKQGVVCNSNMNDNKDSCSDAGGYCRWNPTSQECEDQWCARHVRHHSPSGGGQLPPTPCTRDGNLMGLPCNGTIPLNCPAPPLE